MSGPGSTSVAAFALTEAADVLARRYALVDAALAPIAVGALNQSVLVDHRGHRYVLKRYAPGLYTDDQIARAHAVQAVASGSGIPTAEVFPNRDGHMVTQHQCMSYALYGYVTGRHYARGGIPEEAALAMGQTLGRLLIALATLEPHQRWTVPDPEVARADLSTLLERAEAAATTGADETDAMAARQLRHQLQTMERLAHLAPRLASLPIQVLHGDYQESNIIFAEDDHVAAVVDFDNVRCRPRGQEVMRALALSFEPLSPESLAFFRGYAEVVRPTPPEVELYAPLRAYLGACGSWPLGVKYLKPEQYQARWSRFIKPPSDWWERNQDRVTERLLAVLPGE